MKELCRGRVELERSLRPTTTSGVDFKHKATVIKGEAVYAFPLKMEEIFWHGKCCNTCHLKVLQGRDKDVRLHMVFQPRGQMSPTYPTVSDYTEIRAWDVALSQALYATCPIKGSVAPPKADALYREYADYFPERYVNGGSGYENAKKRTIGRTKTKRAVPQAILDARRAEVHDPELAKMLLVKNRCDPK